MKSLILADRLRSWLNKKFDLSHNMKCFGKILVHIYDRMVKQLKMHNYMFEDGYFRTGFWRIKQNIVMQYIPKSFQTLKCKVLENSEEKEGQTKHIIGTLFKVKTSF